MNQLIHIRKTKSSTVPSEEKEHRLLARIAGLPSVIVALSGGADSAYLAWAAREALGARSLSVTALSPSYSAHDRSVVEEFVGKLGLRQSRIDSAALQTVADFMQNRYIGQFSSDFHNSSGWATIMLIQ